MELTYSFLKMCFSVNSDATNIAGFSLLLSLFCHGGNSPSVSVQ